MRRKPSQVKVGVEDSLRNLSKTMYQYLVIAVFMFIAYYTLFDNTSLHCLNVRKLIRVLTSNCWKSLFMIINRENLKPNTTMTALIYLSFCFSIICVINAFLGLMSADLVKKIEPPIIDTIDDLLNHEDFQGLDVIAPEGAWQEQGFQSAVEGSDESTVSMLWKRNGTRFKMSVTDFDIIFSIMDLVIRSLSAQKAVFIFDTKPLNIFISVGCQVSLDRVGQYLHVSDQKFIPGNLMHAYSPNISTPLRSHFDTSFQRIQESGWADNFFSQVGYKMNLGKIGEYEIYKCIKGLNEREHVIPKAFDVQFLSKPFIWSIYLMIFAFFILLFEQVLAKTISSLGMEEDKK